MSTSTKIAKCGSYIYNKWNVTKKMLFWCVCVSRPDQLGNEYPSRPNGFDGYICTEIDVIRSARKASCYIVICKTVTSDL